MVEDVVGLVIGTRPDCMPISLLDYLEDLGKRTFVLVEYGIESTDDETLRRINRGHTFAVSAEDFSRRAYNSWFARRRKRNVNQTGRSTFTITSDYFKAASVTTY